MKDIVMKASFLTLLWSGCFANSNPPEESDESFLLDIVWKCTRTEDIGNCLKLRAVGLLDKLMRTQDSLIINDYVSLARNPKIPYQELNTSDTNSEGKSFQTNLEEETSKNLDKVIWDKLTSLITTRVVQLNLSSDMFEGRGKDKVFKKGHGMMMMATMMGGMMMKMALGKIAMLAAKALIIGKIALILSLLLALRRFANPAVGAEVVYTADPAVGRKFKSDPSEAGPELAYNAYKPDIYNNF